ncbi:hypothetical protein [Nonomuraea sp. NPDC049400]|uniref:hypothetical protein n=1 Tax=Nonomuraea sp. NPDC049400 TaxID=3364352 RepID=UPI003792BB82
MRTDDRSNSEAYIGDQALLRYLAGNPSFPYDEGLRHGDGLAWPFTTSSGWEAPPRLSFETPWASTGLLAAVVPVLAAAAALLFRSGKR